MFTTEEKEMLNQMIDEKQKDMVTIINRVSERLNVHAEINSSLDLLLKIKDKLNTLPV